MAGKNASIQKGPTRVEALTFGSTHRNVDLHLRVVHMNGEGGFDHIRREYWVRFSCLDVLTDSFDHDLLRFVHIYAKNPKDLPEFKEADVIHLTHASFSVEEPDGQLIRVSAINDGSWMVNPASAPSAAPLRYNYPPRAYRD
ncbi:hypothetical protein EDD11_007358 [Mortierella claussenii]|nr:hypothetical protein EDD11_007358 [Mortierella claussenii]